MQSGACDAFPSVKLSRFPGCIFFYKEGGKIMSEFWKTQDKMSAIIFRAGYDSGFKAGRDIWKEIVAGIIILILAAVVIFI